ncbi:MAG: hypothetical protein EA378_05675 [Phycisphaerales bacterium]|nr:MAG: hypothetical protein EA378_05675 [Phycisphaerales bacterium]
MRRCAALGAAIVLTAAPAVAANPNAAPATKPETRVVDRGAERLAPFFSPAFTNEPYELARVRAVQENKLMVLVIASDRSESSREMDRACWQHPQIVAWLRQHAIAVRAEVGLELSLARGLGVTRVPTVIVFDELGEAARVSGSRDAAWMRAWLTAVRDGRPVANSRPGRDTLTFRPQILELIHFRKMAEEGRTGEAATRLLQMYDNHATEDVYSFPARAREWADAVRVVVELDPTQRPRFLERIAQIEAKLDERETRAIRKDWIHLCQSLNEDHRIVEWFDTVWPDLGLPEGDALADLRFYARALGGPLTRAGRTAAWGQIEPDPVGMVIHAHRIEQELRDEHARLSRHERQSRTIRPVFAERTLIAHLAMLKADRPDDALRAARAAIALDASGGIRRAIVRAAIDADRAHPMHRDLLDPAAPPLLRDRLEQRLQRRVTTAPIPD